jgi:rhamnosyltransferase
MQMNEHLPKSQSESAPSKETICAVFVTYHPDAKFPERVARMAPQVAHIIIVDNNSKEEAVRMLRVLCDAGNFELIENNDNFGVATALNQGAGRAIELGYAWALTVDQDSWPEVHLITALIEIYTSYPDQKKLKIIGSNYRSPVTNSISLQCQDTTSKFIETETVITSCALMSLKAFEEVGPFRDDFFIDQVDDEYCLRLRSHGYKVTISCKPLMIHHLGKQTSHKILWKHPVCLNQPPLRRYYMTRNRLVLYRMYARKEPRWVRNSLSAALKEIVLIILFECQKIKKIIAMLLGIFHALSGRMGRLQSLVLEKR